MSLTTLPPDVQRVANEGVVKLFGKWEAQEWVTLFFGWVLAGGGWSGVRDILKTDGWFHRMSLRLRLEVIGDLLEDGMGRMNDMDIDGVTNR